MYAWVIYKRTGVEETYKCTTDKQSAASDKHVTRCHGNGIYFSTHFVWKDVFVVEEFNRRAIMLWTMLLISFQTGEWI